MKKTIFFLLSSIAVLAGCAKESIAPSAPEGETTVLTVGIDTKTTLGPSESGTRKVYWSENDQINVNGTASRPLTGVTEKQASGTFIFDAILTAPYKAVYPASFYTSDGKITLPATQTYAEGTFATNTSPIVGYLASGTHLGMKNVCAVVKLNIKGSEAKTISYVDFISNGTEQVKGLFSVNYETGVLTSASTSAEDRIVRVNVNKAVTTTNAIDVYVVVPAGTYASGYTIRIVDALGFFMEAPKSASQTLNAGEIVSTKTITYSPTGTIIDISTPAQLNAFTTSFNAGTYAGKTLLVNLTDDITFDSTTSTAFRSIGSTTYAFSGTFDGHNHSIKNLNTTYGMFYTPAGATIKNIVFDSSCTLTHNSSTPAHWGSVVRIASACHISNIIVNANVTMYYSPAAMNAYLGGIVGSLDKSSVMENCKMTGNLNYANNGQVISYHHYIGGVLGYITDASSVIRNCTMSGNFNFPSKTSTPTSSAAGKYINYGGIVGGTGTGGTIDKCSFSGTMTIGDRALDVIAGGISGWCGATVTNCTFSGTIAMNTNYAYTTEAPYTRAFVGGIIGRFTGTMDNCQTASGSKMTITDGRKYSSFGGLVGKTFDSCIVRNSTNKCEITQQTQSSLDIQIGGAVGYISAGTYTNLVNEGAINLLHPNENAGKAQVGGLVGYSAVALSGTSVTGNVSKLHNKGKVSAIFDENSVGFGLVDVGGVVGKTSLNMSYLTNAAYVFVDVRAGDGKLLFKHVSEGGIIGRMEGSSTIDGCVMTGRTQYAGGKAQNDSRTCYVGGIVGTVAYDVTTGGTPIGVQATVSNCHNYGAVNFTNDNRAYPNLYHTQGNCVGGIVGTIVGLSQYSRAVVKDCDHITGTQRIGQTANPDTHYRGYFAGIVGTAYCADITNCVNKTYIKCEPSCAERVSGIVGFTQGYNKVSYCQMQADITNGACIAGIASAGNATGVEFENCIFIGDFVTVKSTSCSGVIHNSMAGVKITNCGVKGTYHVNSSTGSPVAFTDISSTYDAVGKATQSGNYIIGAEDVNSGTAEAFNSSEYKPE